MRTIAAPGTGDDWFYASLKMTADYGLNLDTEVSTGETFLFVNAPIKYEGKACLLYTSG